MEPMLEPFEERSFAAVSATVESCVHRRLSTVGGGAGPARNSPGAAPSQDPPDRLLGARDAPAGRPTVPADRVVPMGQPNRGGMRTSGTRSAQYRHDSVGG